jgi:Na+-transporting NADH:ubiquinone oxidoreductase subunit NqrD
MFEDIEINPIGLTGALLGAVLALVVTKNVDTGIVYKLGASIGTGIACYFVTSKIFQ